MVIKPEPEYQCSKCAYIYEPESGDITSDIPPNTSWGDLPKEWACPHCGASKQVFRIWTPSSEPR
jgi:rubredoxin